MTSKISLLKFGALSLKGCNGAVLNCLKRIRGLGAPISPIRSSGVPIFPIVTVSNLPIATVIKEPQNVPLRHQRPDFPFSKSGHLAPQFPHCLRVSNFPVASSKGQNFPLRHQGPKISLLCRQNNDL